MVCTLDNVTSPPLPRDATAIARPSPSARQPRPLPTSAGNGRCAGCGADGSFLALYLCLTQPDGGQAVDGPAVELASTGTPDLESAATLGHTGLVTSTPAASSPSTGKAPVMPVGERHSPPARKPTSEADEAVCAALESLDTLPE